MAHYGMFCDVFRDYGRTMLTYWYDSPRQKVVGGFISVNCLIVLFEDENIIFEMPRNIVQCEYVGQYNPYKQHIVYCSHA